MEIKDVVKYAKENLNAREINGYYEKKNRHHCEDTDELLDGFYIHSDYLHLFEEGKWGPYICQTDIDRLKKFGFKVCKK